MKKLAILLAVCISLTFSACSRVPFRVGGIQINQTLPTHIIYLFHGDEGWGIWVRFYSVEKEETVEHTVHGNGATVEDAIDEIETLTGHNLLYMSHCGLFLGGDAPNRANELKLFAPYLIYVYLADENVAESEIQDLSSIFYESQASARKNGTAHFVTAKEFVEDPKTSPPRAVLNQGIIEVVED